MWFLLFFLVFSLFFPRKKATHSHHSAFSYAARYIGREPRPGREHAGVGDMPPPFFAHVNRRPENETELRTRLMATPLQLTAPVDLLLIEWNLRQNGRLDYVFGLFCLVSRIHQLATWINQTRRHKDNEIPFDVLFCVVAEETADDWDIA